MPLTGAADPGLRVLGCAAPELRAISAILLGCNEGGVDADGVGGKMLAIVSASARGRCDIGTVFGKSHPSVPRRRRSRGTLLRENAQRGRHVKESIHTNYMDINF